jgi:hypothetical protein
MTGLEPPQDVQKEKVSAGPKVEKDLCYHF